MTRRRVPPADAIAAAVAERDAALEHVTAADERKGGWETRLIDQAIAAFADYGRPFSANDLRELLPEVNPALMGARFGAAATTGLIRSAGLVPSTKKNTHAKRICLWVRGTHQPRTSSQKETASS